MFDFIPTVPPLWQSSLANDVAITDTQATLTPENMISGIPIPNGALVCASIDIGQPNPEYIIGTLTNNVLTFVLRNVDPLDPTVSIGAFTSLHGAGSVVKITDFAAIQIMRNILSGLQAVQNPLLSPNPATLPDEVPNYSQILSAIGSAQVDQTPDNGTYGLVAGLVNGVNSLYTVSLGSYISGKLQVYKNGAFQLQGASSDWQETTPSLGTFTFNTPPAIGDVITVVYGGGGGTGGVLPSLFPAEAVVVGNSLAITKPTFAQATTPLSFGKATGDQKADIEVFGSGQSMTSIKLSLRG